VHGRPPLLSRRAGPVPQVAGVAIPHLSDEGWDFIRPVIDAEAWAAFRGLLAFATWTAAHATERSFTVASKSGHGSVGAA